MCVCVCVCVCVCLIVCDLEISTMIMRIRPEMGCCVTVKRVGNFFFTEPGAKDQKAPVASLARE